MKVTPATDKESKVLQEVYNELKEGINGLEESQIYIHIMDQSKASWRAVAAYKKLGIGHSEEGINWQARKLRMGWPRREK